MITRVTCHENIRRDLNLGGHRGTIEDHTYHGLQPRLERITVVDWKEATNEMTERILSPHLLDGMMYPLVREIEPSLEVQKVVLNLISPVTVEIHVRCIPRRTPIMVA